MKSEILNKIKKISESQKEEEICGFIVEDKGKEHLVECENVSFHKKGNFEISQKKFVEVFEQNKILIIYHSHPENTEQFSKEDINLSESLILPIIVYSNQTEKFNIHIPKGVKRNKSLNRVEKSVVTD